MSDTTTRIINAFHQTDDEAVFRGAVMRILMDDKLPAYREQSTQLSNAINEIDRLKAELALVVKEASEAWAQLNESDTILGRYANELAAARGANNILGEQITKRDAELAKLRALLSSARLAMRICIPKPSCHSIDVIAQIDEAIGEAGVHCSAG